MNVTSGRSRPSLLPCYLLHVQVSLFSVILAMMPIATQSSASL